MTKEGTGHWVCSSLMHSGINLYKYAFTHRRIDINLLYNALCTAVVYVQKYAQKYVFIYI